MLKKNVQQYRIWLGLSYQSIAIQGKDCDGLIKRTRGQSPTITAPSNRMNLWRMRLIFTCLVMSFEMVLKFVNLTEKWCHCSHQSVYTPRASVQVITQKCVQMRKKSFISVCIFGLNGKDANLVDIRGRKYKKDAYKIEIACDVMEMTQ